jgi:hypothetical protein
MTILSVVKDVCSVVGVTAPTSIFASITGNRTMQEMLSLANEMAQRIAYNTRDWSMLKATVTHNGDGVITAFPMPSDYKRMLLTSNVWRSTSTQSPMTFIPDTDEWLNRRAGNASAANAWGEWTMYGGRMHIYPTLPLGQSAYYAYLDKNCVALAPGGYGDVFQNDLDTYRLDERTLKLAMIWQWRAYKGSPYAEDVGTYADALAYEIGQDGPAPIMIGRGSNFGRSAYPSQTVYVPGMTP